MTYVKINIECMVTETRVPEQNMENILFYVILMWKIK